MSRSKIFVTRRLPISLSPLEAVAEVVLWPERQPPPYEVLRRESQRCEGLLCLLTDRIDAALLQASPQLKVVSQMAVGYDNIDVKAATALKIPVGHTPGVLTEATADLTWALLMAAARRVVEGDRFTRSGQWTTWEPDLLLGPDVAGATLGIVGLGRIGQAVARRALGFDMRVLYTAPRPVDKALEQQIRAEYVDLSRVLREADFITLHVPLTTATHHLLGAAQFQQMKPTAVLINTARGAIVDQKALYEALQAGQLAGAALDVTEPEPTPLTEPLLSLPSVIVTPHIGSASRQAREKMAQIAIANLLAGLRDDPLPHCVNSEIYG
ncbi:D-glycerate dehydrogenase [Pseudanabaena sp. FACHB-2040]|uniref:2-hydroxyacid dehydrogenase n=1 Tax=Pseudanabaena sp. FACHB-2040 TaxID=2692859 RepID=UPI0016861760|nr:D-glycerate dehydrogenase [Pseudanabaena sp. FACHB-2040]MBD2257295.1 D-glycerate dehydrogenase [Pseudanabaena sp. FACHB-2040]